MIPVFDFELSGNEKKYVNECIDENQIGSFGKYIDLFEEKFSLLVNRKYSSFCSSGTAAIELVAESLDFKKGDEIIFPAFTIISCVYPFVKKGVKPVIIDCEKGTYNICVDSLEDLINKNTKAIFIAHIYGLTCKVDEIERIAKKHGIIIIEDAAEVIGQTYKNKACGSFGKVSVFSFYSNKHITCGEGGMVSTNDSKLYRKINYYKNLCFGKNRFVHKHFGYNYRATNIQAAIGLAQLEEIQSTIIKKKLIGLNYQKLLKNLSSYIDLPIEKTDYCENIYWVFPILLKNSNRKKTREIRNNLLKEFDIDTRPLFYPMNKQPVFQELGFFKNIKMPVAESLYNNGFYIPAGTNITIDQQKFVADSLLKLIK